MTHPNEIRAALEAFNRIRIEVGGIKTEADQERAMSAALDAAERARRVIDGLSAS